MDVFLASADWSERSVLRLVCLQETDARVVGQTGYGRDLLQAIHRIRPDLLLLDWGLPFLEGSGPSGDTDVLIAALHKTDPRLRIIVLDRLPETKDAALSAGADAFVCTADPSQTLVEELLK